ncbi:MAG: hypothetical protein ABSB82_25140 [Terriglobia bacterium]|jgi:hypothetical protein
MVTGFNTDIKHEGVVYHVQTEPRKKDAGIETMVYIRGAIIHKLTTSCEEFVRSPEYSDEKLKKMLEDQHRLVIGRIRAGEIKPAAPPPAGL